MPVKKTAPPKKSNASKQRTPSYKAKSKAVKKSIAKANENKSVTPLEKDIAKQMKRTSSVLEAVCLANLSKMKATDIVIHDRATISFEIDILFTYNNQRYGLEVQDRFSHSEVEGEIYLPKLPLKSTKQPPSVFELKKKLAFAKGVMLIELYEDEIMAKNNVGNPDTIARKIKEYKKPLNGGKI